jgi:hypothetical protein
MRLKTFAACVTAASLFGAPLAAQDTALTGTGTVPVTRDANSTRAAAEDAARQDLVRALARQVLGAERLGEITPDMTRQLAGQIRPEMITNRSSERVGRDFRVTLTAQIDRAWFQRQLEDFGIRSSVDRAGGDQQLVVVIIDESIGEAPELGQPAEVVTEFDRDTRASYSDQSTVAMTDRTRAAESSAVAGSSAARGSYAAGYSGPYSEGAARGSGSSANAYSARSGAAYSRDTALIDRNDVEASTSDTIRFRQRVTYQSAASSQTGLMAMSALTEGLQRHDITTANAAPMMAGFAPGPMPMFADLQSSGRLDGFFAYARGRQAPFVMSGQLLIDHAGRHPATGEVTCNGRFSASAYSTATGRDFASAARSLTITAPNTSACEGTITTLLSREVADVLGPEIQRQWRSETRDRAEAVAVASGPADWAIDLRATNLSMAAQADFLDAVASLPGVQNQVFLNQTSTQMEIQIRYSGSEPLHLALFRRLRNSPAFADMVTETVPGRLSICLSGC